MESPFVIQALGSLSEQFGRPGRLSFNASPSGLIAAEITSELCRGQIYLQGAHVTVFQPVGQASLLWMSSASLFQSGKAIRGGIPLCWPWFANHPTDSSKPAHGFARTALWRLLEVEHLDSGAISLILDLDDSQQTHALWPFSFAMRLIVTFGRSLRLALIMENRSSSEMSISCALHTYFRIHDWRTCSVHGLEDADYLDKVEAFARKTQRGPVRFNQETDRIYLLPDADCRIESPESRCDILLRQQGGTATVVWNPGPVKAAAMGDMAGEEYRQMVCVESAIAPQVPVVLQPGAEHELQMEIAGGPWR